MRKKFLSLALVVAMIAMLFVFSGCSKAESNEPEIKPEIESEIKSEPESESETDETLETTQKVVGMDGIEVELPKKVRSIVDTWSAATDNLFNLGAGDLLVSAHSAAVSEWSKRIYPPIADLPDYSKATAEELLKINPDMVIVTNTEKATELRNAGVNAINLMYLNYEDFKKSTLIMGQILGDEYAARAQKVAEYVDWVMQTLNDSLKDLKDEERPVVHYIMTNDVNNPYSSGGGGSIMDEWINLAGGKMATANLGKGMGLKDVTAEQILATNPDIIMIDGDNAAEVREALKSMPEWSDITAVKNNDIYCIPKGCFWWGRLCGDTPLQPLWAASIIHPDKITYDIREETKKFYKEFKQCELTDDEVDKLLRVELLPKK
jgi:iron complex transport system substrate-binding protein